MEEIDPIPTLSLMIPYSSEIAASLQKTVRNIKIGREILAGKKAELRAIDIIGANDLRLEKLHEAQDLAEALLDAEVELGKIIASIPEASGLRTDLEPPDNGVQRLTKQANVESIGLSVKQAYRFEQLASRPDILQKVKQEFRDADEIVNRTQVLKAISHAGKPYIINNTGNSEWYTPEKYINSARIVMGGIDLDPASCDFANDTVKADTWFTRENDGLCMEWTGRIWLNPPYSDVQKFTTKLLKSDYSEAIVLVNNATETQWFLNLMERASAIVFHTGRLEFMNPEGEGGKAMQGQAFVYLGDKPDAFWEEFSQYGWGTLIINQSKPKGVSQ